MKADIYHLYHSGVAVEFNNKFLVFDYYNDRPSGGERKIENGVLDSAELVEKENVYIFVSHNHPDHFNQVIFDWQENKEDIRYLMSSDLKPTIRKNVYEKIVDQFKKLDEKSASNFLNPGDEVEIDQLLIEAYDSTDKGVSFLVKSDQLNIFHAGDLNWWHWKNNTKKEQEMEEENYKKEIDKLQNEKIDIAFIPVDPRLEEYFYLAGKYFIEKIEPKMLVPIHFSNNFSITEKFAQKVADYPTEVAKINKRGQKIIYSD